MSTVISVENLSKSYRLGQINTGTFTYDLQAWWARVRGIPVPWQTIGEPDDRHRDGEIVWALKDVSFKVEQGEVLGIIGRNGAGKSTLLKILSRVTAPTSGKVKIKGRIASLLEVGTGFHPDLTGRENVYLNGAIMGMDRQEVARKFDEIVDFSGVEQFIDTPVKRYSSGMYVRLAFAVAAHLDPEILVVDEVLAVGDAEFQKKCLGKMGDVAKEGRTVLFVSHNMSAMTTLCNFGFLLDHGQIVLTDHISKVVSRYLSNRELKKEYVYLGNTDKRKFTFIRARLLKDGETSSTFYTSDLMKVQIECVINEPMEGVQVAFELLTEFDQCIFSTTSQDHPGYSNDLILPGIYTFECLVELRMLRPGKYRINISSSIPNFEILEIVDQSLVFDLLDDSSPILRLAQDRKGMILPVLPWTVSKKIA